jgi:hypothetical protein
MTYLYLAKNHLDNGDELVCDFSSEDGVETEEIMKHVNAFVAWAALEWPTENLFVRSAVRGLETVWYQTHTRKGLFLIPSFSPKRDLVVLFLTSRLIQLHWADRCSWSPPQQGISSKWTRFTVRKGQGFPCLNTRLMRAKNLAEKVLVRPTNRFLSWKEIQERARNDMPVSVSVIEGDGSISEFGCIPAIDDGVIRLGGHISSRGQKIDTSRLSMVSISGRKVSVMEGEFISRILVRDASRAALFHTEIINTVEKRAILLRQLGEYKIVYLFIDEPVDPSGRRCLYYAGGQWGGADLDWVIENSVARVNPGFMPSLCDIPHIHSFLWTCLVPKDLHRIRLARAPLISKIWGKKNPPP